MGLERRGQVIAVELGPTGLPGGALLFGGRRQPSCDGMSRMMREYHVRFCEGLGVKFPGPTRHQQKNHPLRATSAMTSSNETADAVVRGGGGLGLLLDGGSIDLDHDVFLKRVDLLLMA